jgi:transposase InsO family protein
VYRLLPAHCHADENARLRSDDCQDNIDWWNHRRLHGEIGMRIPAETETAYYAQPALLTEAGIQ